MSLLLSLPLMIIPMMLWRMTGIDDLTLVNIAVACLVCETWKATATGFQSMVDFVLSLGLAVGALFLALTNPAFKDPLFITLVIFAFADVASGSIITMRSARRDIGIS